MKKTTVSALALFWLCVDISHAADERDPHVETLLPGVQLSLVAEHPALATPTGTAVRGTGEGGIFRCSPDGKNLRRIA